jgi:hypothetical protein
MIVVLTSIVDYLLFPDGDWNTPLYSKLILILVLLERGVRGFE